MSNAEVNGRAVRAARNQALYRLVNEPWFAGKSPFRRAQSTRCSQALDHAGDRLAEADAHAADPVALAAPLKLAE